MTYSEAISDPMANGFCKFVRRGKTYGLAAERLCQRKLELLALKKVDDLGTFMDAIEKAGKAPTIAADRDCPFFDSDDFEHCPGYVSM
jgi:hypothetical protein